MTLAITNKLFPKAGAPKELVGRIRYAAAVEQLCNLSGPELAAELTIAVDTLVGWKLRPEWDEAVQAIRTTMFYMSPKLRAYIQDTAERGLGRIQREVVETVLDMAFPPTEHSAIGAKP
jgi:hypothetical protein